MANMILIIQLIIIYKKNYSSKQSCALVNKYFEWPPKSYWCVWERVANHIPKNFNFFYVLRLF